MLWLKGTLTQINYEENHFLELHKNIEGDVKDLKRLQLDFELSQWYRNKFIFVKIKLNLKLKDLQKEENISIADLTAALSSININLTSMVEHKIIINVPK